MGVGMWMTWGRPGCGENGSLGGVEQVGRGESWIGGGTWRVLNSILFLTFLSPGLCSKRTRSACSGSSWGQRTCRSACTCSSWMRNGFACALVDWTCVQHIWYAKDLKGLTYRQRTFHSVRIQTVCPQCAIVGVPGAAKAGRMLSRKPCWVPSCNIRQLKLILMLTVMYMCHLPALVWEVVCQNVHGQGRHAHVHLPAYVALFGIVRVQRSVRLQYGRCQINPRSSF